MHNLYHIEGLTDLSVLEEQARKYADGTFGKAIPTMIHKHRYLESCNDECRDYPAKE